MSSWIQQPSVKGIPADSLYCSTSTLGYGSNFFNFFMCYLYARSQNKVLYLKDTKNNITDSFHLILDTFQELPGITYTLKNGMTVQQLYGNELKKFCVALDEEVLKAEAKRIFKLQPAIQTKINILKKGLSSFDLGVHVRTGDKITTKEMTKIPIEYYFKQITDFQVASGKKKLSIYLMTDSATVIAQFKKKADPTWSIVSIPSPITNQDGHFQTQFNSYPIAMKMDAYIHFLAEIQILQSCPTVLCTFSSNIGRFIYLTGGTDVRSLDTQFEL